MELVGRFFEPPRSSFFLFGPRGTGKTVWTTDAFPDALRVDLLDPETYRLYGARPERLREIVDGHPDARQVVVDEVQRVPEVLSVVHELTRRRGRSQQFILTGSSSRKLKRTGVDMLAGRAVVKTMHPYMAGELLGRFDLVRALRQGLVPLVVESPEPEETLRTYATLYLREEVLYEGIVRQVGAFARFLETMSLSHGRTLNTSNVARECQVGRKTVEGYVAILEDLLLGWRVPVFERRTRRELAAHPKFYFFDAGVFRSLRPAGPLDRPEEIDGAALEGLVAQHLRAWIGYRRDRHDMFHWRTRSGVEVDFVIYGETGIWAVEVKNASRVQSVDLRGLRSFRDDYPQTVAILLYRGRERLRIGGIHCVPVADFLKRLHPGRALFQ
ncbi:MAG: DUF4143 domain-containing protein [Acidobacteriota bacterium]